MPVCACSEPGEGSSAPPAGEQERRDPPRTLRPAAGTPCTLTSSAALSDRHWEDIALLLSGTKTWTWMKNVTWETAILFETVFCAFSFSSLSPLLSAGLCFGLSALLEASRLKLAEVCLQPVEDRARNQPPGNRSTRPDFSKEDMLFQNVCL